MSEKTLAQKMQGALRIGRACRLVWQHAPGWTVASVVLLFLQGILPVAALRLIQLIFDGVTAGLSAADKVLAFQQVLLTVILAGAVALLGNLLSSLDAFVREIQGQIVTDRISASIHAKSVEADLAYYENPRYYDTLHRAQSEGPHRPVSIVNNLTSLGQNMVMLASIAGLLLYLPGLSLFLRLEITLVLFLAAIPGVVARYIYAGRMYRWQRDSTNLERRAWYYSWLLTSGASAKEIRLFDIGPFLIGLYNSIRDRLRGERKRLAVRRSMAQFLGQFLATGAMFGAYAFVVWQAVRGLITVGGLVLYYQAFQRVQSSFQQVLESLTALYEDNLFLTNLYEFLDLRPKVSESAQPVVFPRPIKTGIVFEHVSFQYPDSGRTVLNDVSLTINPGERVALVGGNGSGKTTLVKLLCRFYDPTAGRILIDGVDLRAYRSADLRRAVSVIFQDYLGYNMTAAENIWVAENRISAQDDGIRKSAIESGADEFLSGLPHGYETMLGKWFDEGEELSMGQWQKVALARVFLRKAQIVVLDEPTSFLDARAESGIFAKFHDFSQGLSTLLISHRFSTIRLADRVYVIEKGRIVESGTHQELLRQAGIYRRLFDIQSSYYR